MTRFQKRLILGILVVILITPIGIILPELFKSGDAWGEWSVETIKEKIGYVPEGMKKDEKVWKVPMTDYSLGKNDNSIVKKSGSYLLSGFVGVACITLLSFGVYKLIKRE
jgi:cobalt/nickel transport protein